MNEYEKTRRITYKGGAVFIPVCQTCGRFVKADEFIKVNDLIGLSPEPNATCSKCGRVQMIFEGFFGSELENGHVGWVDEESLADQIEDL